MTRGIVLDGDVPTVAAAGIVHTHDEARAAADGSVFASVGWLDPVKHRQMVRCLGRAVLVFLDGVDVTNRVAESDDTRGEVWLWSVGKDGGNAAPSLRRSGVVTYVLGQRKEAV